MAPNYVYAVSLIQNPLMVKIGLSTRWETRQKQLKIGTKTKLEALIRCSDANTTEKTYHRQHDAIRLPQSEWFLFKSEKLKLRAIDIIQSQDPASAPEALPIPKPELPEDSRVSGWELAKYGLYRTRLEHYMIELHEEIVQQLVWQNPFIMDTDVDLDEEDDTWKVYIDFVDPNGTECFATLNHETAWIDSYGECDTWHYQMFKTNEWPNKLPWKGDPYVSGPMDGHQKFLETLDLLKQTPRTLAPMAVKAQELKNWQKYREYCSTLESNKTRIKQLLQGGPAQFPYESISFHQNIIKNIRGHKPFKLLDL